MTHRQDHFHLPAQRAWLFHFPHTARIGALVRGGGLLDFKVTRCDTQELHQSFSGRVGFDLQRPLGYHFGVTLLVPFLVNVRDRCNEFRWCSDRGEGNRCPSKLLQIGHTFSFVIASAAQDCYSNNRTGQSFQGSGGCRRRRHGFVRDRKWAEEFVQPSCTCGEIIQCGG